MWLHTPALQQAARRVVGLAPGYLFIVAALQTTFAGLVLAERLLPCSRAARRVVGLAARYLFIGRCAPNRFCRLVLAERLLP
jgi:hypothetical protein